MKNSIKAILIVLIIVSCEGPEGEVGPEGLKSLIKVDAESQGQNCPTGGLKIKNGIDTNNNDILDENEVQSTDFLCNGVNGAQGSSGVNIIRIPLQVAFTWRQAETIWGGENKDQLLVKFNVLDYPDFTKAFFVAQFDRNPDNTTDSLYLRLYDYKNQNKIVNSEVWSTITNTDFNADPNKRVVQSVDIF